MVNQTAMTPRGLLQAEEAVTMVTKAWTKDMLHESIYTALFHQTTHCFQFPNKKSERGAGVGWMWQEH